MTGEVLSTPGGISALASGWILMIASHAPLQSLLLRVLSQAGYTALGCATRGEAEPILLRFASPRLILFDVASATEEALPLHKQDSQVEDS